MEKMHKPNLMEEKWWRMYVDFTWSEITLIEEWEKLWHYIWDVTEDCVRSVLLYWRYKATEMCKDYVQFSHPTSWWIIEVRKKNMPRYKKLFYIFK